MGTAEDMKKRGFVGIYEKEPRHRIPAAKISQLLQKAVAEW
jgi:hypothetical protein